MEVWKDIPGYEGLYQVSSLGRIKSLDRHRMDGRHYRERILKPSSDLAGYLSVELCKEGTGKRILVHRLVAQVFVPNPENKKEVNHINGTKADNRSENLEWNTSSENQLHAFRTGLEKKSTRAVLQCDLQGDLVKEWASATEAAIHTGARKSNICHCCKGRLKSTGGFIWKYKEAV
jgi:hypothetical protein